MMNRTLIIVVVAIQILCAVFFASQILAAFIDLPFGPIDWALYELIEIGAALGLLIGIVMGALVLRQSFARTARAEDALRLASGAFMDVLEERFAHWGLTPAERDVALFAIKGMSTAEIAGLRDTSEGTVKAQTNAIYRKAGVSGRPQLLSLFIDDLMEAEG
ncbi:MAG: LuxR C-terminal-related transcriptional regulator [Pseudomonadota bacterium]